MSNEPDMPPVPPPVYTAAPPAQPGLVDTVIPTSNPDSLLSYYVGLFAILPLAGLIMGPLAISRGRRAIARTKEVPQLPGKTHAMVGIGCGAIGLLFNLLIVAFVIAVAFFR